MLAAAKANEFSSGSQAPNLSAFHGDGIPGKREFAEVFNKSQFVSGREVVLSERNLLGKKSAARPNEPLGFPEWQFKHVLQPPLETTRTAKNRGHRFGRIVPESRRLVTRSPPPPIHRGDIGKIYFLRILARIPRIPSTLGRKSPGFLRKLLLHTAGLGGWSTSPRQQELPQCKAGRRTVVFRKGVWKFFTGFKGKTGFFSRGERRTAPHIPLSRGVLKPRRNCNTVGSDKPIYWAEIGRDKARSLGLLLCASKIRDYRPTAGTIIRDLTLLIWPEVNETESMPQKTCAESKRHGNQWDRFRSRCI